MSKQMLNNNKIATQDMDGKKKGKKEDKENQ